MANKIGSVANSSSRRCFTLVKVTTPMAPRTPLPTKLAVAEKHTAGFSVVRIIPIFAERKRFIVPIRSRKENAAKTYCAANENSKRM
jgi:hypothetical protein